MTHLILLRIFRNGLTNWKLWTVYGNSPRATELTGECGIGLDIELETHHRSHNESPEDVEDVDLAEDPTAHSRYLRSNRGSSATRIATANAPKWRIHLLLILFQIFLKFCCSSYWFEAYKLAEGLWLRSSNWKWTFPHLISWSYCTGLGWSKGPTALGL